MHGRLAVDARGTSTRHGGFGPSRASAPIRTIRAAASARPCRRSTCRPRPIGCANFRGRARGYFQNKAPSGVLRAVGQPIACTVTEQLIDLRRTQARSSTRRRFRRRNYAPPRSRRTRAAPAASCSASCRSSAATTRLLAAHGLRRAAPRAGGSCAAAAIYRGIGLAAFIEQTAVGPALYGLAAVRVSAHEACRLALDPDRAYPLRHQRHRSGPGHAHGACCRSSRDAIGVDPAMSRSSAATRPRTPFGGGAWASRGTALGGEAALRAARKLRQNILAIAGSLLQARPVRAAHRSRQRSSTPPAWRS